jgi:putative FmdB family regulatory protein
MPTYLYCCDTCKREFEEFHSINDKLEECPKCKADGLPSQPVTRLISSGTTFILSGSGWARDNYS